LLFKVINQIGMLKENKKLTSFLWLLGTLVIGALGNGLWELAKPGLVWLSNATLDVATLGLSSLRDSMYSDIAKGTYERAAEKLLNFIFSVFAGAIIGILIALWFNKRRKTNTETTLLTVARLGGLKTAMVASLAMFASFMLVETLKTIYIVRAANHMEQIQRAIAPYQTEQQRLMLASRFALMSSRKEYIELIGAVKSVAAANNIKIPDFNIY
jgi:hypothetical protein